MPVSSAPRPTVHRIVDSPLGPLTLVAEDGALIGLYLHGQRHRPVVAALGRCEPEGFGAATEQLDAYFAGEATTFDLPLAPRGTAFQRQVWAALEAIPYGETRTYASLAGCIGRPSATRAVGAAVGRNPLSIVVPCHRVVGARGQLTGYAGGLERKRRLLELERARATRERPGAGSGARV